MPRYRLTETDRRVLHTLTHCVRVADGDQLATVSQAQVERRLVSLRERGLLNNGAVTVRRPQPTAPVWNWQPGDPAPAAGPLAWQLQKRWQVCAPQTINVWWATSDAARLMGGVGGRLRQPLQVAHDLGVTDVYSRFVAADPGTAGPAGTNPTGTWMGEDNYRREFRPLRKVKVPDAVVLDADGDIERVIEFGGAYPARRVEAFHRYWSRQQIPYEVW